MKEDKATMNTEKGGAYKQGLDMGKDPGKA